jgi:peroxiredoxin
VNTLPSTTKGQPLPSLNVGTPAPPFSTHTLEGAVVTLETSLGKPTFLAFVAPGCAACHEVLPVLNEIATQSTRSSVTTLVVSGADREHTQRMVEALHLSLPVIPAPSEASTLFHDYKIAGTPSYCFIDEKGIVKQTGHLSPSGEEWSELIA